MSQYELLSNFRSYSRYLRCFVLLLFLNLSSFAFSGSKTKDSRVSFKSTHIEEIKKFVDLPGGRYTIGYGYDYFAEKIIPLAVYDKTFPEIFNKKMTMRLLLSAFGIGDLNIENLRKKIERKREGKKKKKLKRKMIEKVLFDSYGSRHQILFDKDWWRDPSLLWKKECKPNLSGPAPDSIAFSCLNLESFFSKKGKSTSKILETFLLSSFSETEDYSQMKDSGSATNLDKSFFARQNDGSYLLNVEEKKSVAPVKVIDLQGYNSSYKTSLSWIVKTNLVKVLISVSQIPIVFIPHTLSAILERYFNYIEILYLARHSEALNLIVEAKLGRKKSPFYSVLSQEEMDHSIQYLRRSFTFISCVLKNTFIKKEDISEKYMEKVKKKRKANIEQLLSRGYKVIPFEKSTFALGVKRDDKNEIEKLEVFSLIKRKTFSTKPHAVVDFLDPLRCYYERNILEAILIASYFSYTPTALSSILFFSIKTTYKEVVIREMQRYQMQEASFLGYLESNQSELKQAFLDEGIEERIADRYIRMAYKIVKKRSLNPLFLDREEAAHRKAKSELWLRNHDFNYRPFSLTS